MATVNALITSPTPLVNTTISSGNGTGTVTTGTYTNNTGKYLLVITNCSRPWHGTTNTTSKMTVNINSGGGGTAYSITIGPISNNTGSTPNIDTPIHAAATFVLAPNQGFSWTVTRLGATGSNLNAASASVIGYSLSPEF